MRTTIRLDDQLLKEAKTSAVSSGQTLTQFISDALRESLSRRARRPQRRRITLPTSGGGGLMPGVDISDSAALLDIMEEYDKTH